MQCSTSFLFHGDEDEDSDGSQMFEVQGQDEDEAMKEFFLLNFEEQHVFLSKGRPIRFDFVCPIHPNVRQALLAPP